VRLKTKILVLAAGVVLVAANAFGRQFQLMEASISDIHGAFQSGRLTCRDLVQQYLDRIKAYDQQGPAINAMLYVNPKALEQADAMDKAFSQGAKLEPLQCIPLVLKDLFDTADMPTTGGSLALKGMQPAEDAFTVVRLRQAGALIIGKTNLHELAITGITVSSLGGQTKNPYELTRTPGGSSGGTGAALAANFAAVGTGSDTVNSIRSPSSANSLVGIRPTRGLISRAGVIPCSFTQDAVGPITRTVADAAVVLDVMAGYDPDDPVTALGVGKIPRTYTSFLDRTALKGARIGVLRTLFGSGPDHQEVNRVMANALEGLKQQGGFGFFHDVRDNFARARQLDCSLELYRKLLIRTTSLVRIPLARNNCLPSRDHEKPKMRPEVKSVTGCGSPPVSGCSQTFVAPLRVSRKSNPLPSGDQCGGPDPDGRRNVCRADPPAAGITAYFVWGIGLPSCRVYATNLPSGDMRAFPPPPGVLAISVGVPPSTDIR